MRYIRFLKAPRIVEKNSPKAEVQCLITITSDLGDSFLPYDVELAAELLTYDSNKVLVSRTVKWVGGTRSLSVTLPLSDAKETGPIRVRIGTQPKLQRDEFSNLLEPGSRGVVSAWSAQLDPSKGIDEADKLVERRFDLGSGKDISVWEETGDSIARHLWDAGIVLSCYTSALWGEEIEGYKKMRIVELGTGCGMVGITIARLSQDTSIVITDLAEAKEIANRNINQNKPGDNTKIVFKELDWKNDLPKHLQDPPPPCPHCAQFDLVIAADCTYNPDSSPALVKTLKGIAETSPDVTIAISMKMRHSSEEIFFNLMSDAKFVQTSKVVFPLPGDEKPGEETVQLFFYNYDGEGNHDIVPNEFCTSREEP